MSAPVTVLLADDHPVVRRGIRAVLDLDARIEVVGDVGDADEAVRGAPGVDVVVMDLQFGAATAGEPAGIRATREIVDARPAGAASPRVLVLTTYDAESDVLGALDAGAAGYVLKSADPQELIDAVLGTHAGQTVLAAPVAGRLVRRTRRPEDALTARELEVLGLVAAGRSNQEIAAALYLSQATVKTHLAHVFTKLDVDSRTAAVARAVEDGVLRR